MECVRKREKLLRKIESIKKKLPWLKYDMRKRKRRKWRSEIEDEIAKLIAEQKAPVKRMHKSEGQRRQQKRRLQRQTLLLIV